MKNIIKNKIMLTFALCVIVISLSGCQVFQKLAVSMQVRNYVNVLKEENVDKLMSMLSESYIDDIIEARSGEKYNPATNKYEKVEYTKEDLRKDLKKQFDDDFQVTGVDLSYLEIVVEGNYAKANNIYLKGRFGDDEDDVFWSEYLRLKKEGNKWMIIGCFFVGTSYYYYD